MADLRIVTTTHDGRILTNNNIWTADSRSIVYDTRSDRLGDVFDGVRIMQLDIDSGEEHCLYKSKNGAGCGVVTTHPFDDRYVFIAGPEHPTSDWTYGPSHRQGMIGHRSSHQTAHNMDAREITEHPCQGALRGGTHVHMWHPKGDWLRSTYNDASTAQNVRDVVIHIPGNVEVSASHPRNHSGNYHSFIVTDTVVKPSNADQITRAYEETWLGSTRQIAFMADTTVGGDVITEIFKVDAATITLASKHTFDTAGRIKPPTGIPQTRLTHFSRIDLRIAKKPRHWLASSPDGNTLAVLLQSNNAYPQLYTLDLRTLKLTQRTFVQGGVTTAISWSRSGSAITFGADNAVFVIDTVLWKVRKVATVTAGELLPLCCCISPDEKRIAVEIRLNESNHIAIATLE
ncbi:MAG: DUF3748 domain-containing protein [Armatimonadota bacterium]